MATPKKTPNQAPKKTPNKPATAKPVIPAEVLPTGVAKATPAGTALLDPATQPDSGHVENSPLLGDGAGDPLPELVAESVTVIAQDEGFRRAGIRWSRTPTTVLIDDLSDADIKALVSEPLLDVVFNAAPDHKIAG
ncbi:MAG: hypothetical protein HYU74_12625 [Dechloromonas sp.]|nr:hypothetical protein [Dechloromonas sp.]